MDDVADQEHLGSSWLCGDGAMRHMRLEITTCHELHQGHLENSFQVYYEWRA